MAKGTTGRRRSRKCRSNPYCLPSANQSEHMKQKKCSKIFEKKDWEDATCSICMEYPHNAVLLMCSSHDKGCRPYMCGTNLRYSNCHDQYRKTSTKVTLQHYNRSFQGSIDTSTVGSFSTRPAEKELACPLCRGQVKGWTVVEPARKHLNAKQRSCTQDDCSFVGSYREMRKHVREEHPCARSGEVDPLVEQKWRSLERELERNDVISAITSSTPRVVVSGDYIIEGSGNPYSYNADAIAWNERFGMRNTYGSRGSVSSARNIEPSRGPRQHERDVNNASRGNVAGIDHNLIDENFISLVGRFRERQRGF